MGSKEDSEYLNTDQGSRIQSWHRCKRDKRTKQTKIRSGVAYSFDINLVSRAARAGLIVRPSLTRHENPRQPLTRKFQLAQALQPLVDKVLIPPPVAIKVEALLIKVGSLGVNLVRDGQELMEPRKDYHFLPPESISDVAVFVPEDDCCTFQLPLNLS